MNDDIKQNFNAILEQNFDAILKYVNSDMMDQGVLLGEEMIQTIPKVSNGVMLVALSIVISSLLSKTTEENKDKFLEALNDIVNRFVEITTIAQKEIV